MNEKYLSSMRQIAEVLASEDTASADVALKGFDLNSIPAISSQTGSALIDQFKPWFFGCAFPYCFPWCAGLPDYGTVKDYDPQQHRRRHNPGAPSVELRKWCSAIARRVETQCGRDWMLGFAMWNYIFRTSINQTTTLLVDPSFTLHANQRSFREPSKQF